MMGSQPRCTRSSMRKTNLATPPNVSNDAKAHASTSIIKNGSVSDDGGPKRGSVGLRIEMKLTHGGPELVDALLVRKVFYPYACLNRISIDVKMPKRVIVTANAASVSQALRITRDLQKHKFSQELEAEDDLDEGELVEGELEITHLDEAIKLHFTQSNPLQYDSTLRWIEDEDFGEPIEYDPNWYGRELALYQEYQEIMINAPRKFPGRPKYPIFPAVADFWKDNCGQKFPALAAKFANPKTKNFSKAEMSDFYYHLFNAIFDMGIHCAPDEGLNYDEARWLPGFSGWDIHVTQPKVHGTIMIVEYIPANFWGRSEDGDSEGSAETSSSSSSDEDSSKEGSPVSLRDISEEAWNDTQTRLKLFAAKNGSDGPDAKDGPLYTFGALKYIYGMTAYRDKVFYSRLHRETSMFEILNSQKTFEWSRVAPGEKPLWQSVLTLDGYQRFQAVLNQMNDDIAAA